MKVQDASSKTTHKNQLSWCAAEIRCANQWKGCFNSKLFKPMRSWYRRQTLRRWQHLIRDLTRICRSRICPVSTWLSPNCSERSAPLLGLSEKRQRSYHGVCPPVRHIPLRPLQSPSAHRHHLIGSVMKHRQLQVVLKLQPLTKLLGQRRKNFHRLTKHILAKVAHT